jgi:hypothetical protein
MECCKNCEQDPLALSEFGLNNYSINELKFSDIRRRKGSYGETRPRMGSDQAKSRLPK